MHFPGFFAIHNAVRIGELQSQTLVCAGDSAPEPPLSANDWERRGIQSAQKRIRIKGNSEALGTGTQESDENVGHDTKVGVAAVRWVAAVNRESNRTMDAWCNPGPGPLC